MVGEGNDEERAKASEAIEATLQSIRAVFEESLALVLDQPRLTSGRFAFEARWTPHAGGVSFQQANVRMQGRFPSVSLTDEQLTELGDMWRLVRQLPTARNSQGISLALRRLSYQAQRERPEDELLDLMIAAEALYMADLGNEPYRGELRYRLALRAAAWADPIHIGLSRREVFQLMQSAYDARSAIAHGGTPKPASLKYRGERVTLPEIVTAARSILRAASRAALSQAESGAWPPDWEKRILGG